MTAQTDYGLLETRCMLHYYCRPLPSANAMHRHTRPIRVAIIGGGCAAMAAALELTRPEQEGRYEVTVYQLGWRLGGKGASGRGPEDRIEEHGLHVWMGWYENAFRLLRECYAELGRDWQSAFQPASLIAVCDRSQDGRWEPWIRLFPPAEGLPGDPVSHRERWTVRGYLGRTVDLLRALLTEIDPTIGGEMAHSATTAPNLDRLESAIRYGEFASLAAIGQAVTTLGTIIGSLDRYPHNPIVRFLDALGTSTHAALTGRLEADAGLRRIWHVADLALATIRGNLRFGIATDPRGFDAVDDYDCREWLLLNGASREAVDGGYLRGLYDLGFAYEDGDPTRPRVSAAQALRGFLRAFFTYRGSFFWKMNAGMGDVVFAPMYEVLRGRGVRFEFFHRLRNVGLSPADARGRPHVATLAFDVQARTSDGRPYQPLVTVHGVPCWPAEPDWSQLEHGDRFVRERWRFESHWDERRVDTKTLRVGEDFDLVVLGVGLGAIPHVAGELVARDPRWREMVEHVKTVATQAFQIWLQPDMAQLGWSGAPVTLSGFVEPFDTWADMRHLLAAESWRNRPGSLAYFCNVLPDLDGIDPRDPRYPEHAREQVRQSAIRFLNRDIHHLWKNARAADGGFRWDWLVAPALDGAVGSARFDAQYWTANVNPSDRYTLALPGSARYRISPLDESYDNLTVCGDWTDSGFNSGCVESAIMSGMLAAHALSQRPQLDDIVGFDHP